MNNLEQFLKEKYLNLETFRKSGESIKRKHGLIRKMFSIGSASRGRQDTILEIKLSK